MATAQGRYDDSDEEFAYLDAIDENEVIDSNIQLGTGVDNEADREVKLKKKSMSPF
jgi:hypothetical protein